MAGAGVRVFQPGEVLTAALVNTYLQDQVVCRFDNTTDRDTSFGGAGQPVLEEGRICYLDSSNELQYYDGSAWVTISPEAVTSTVSQKGDLIAGTAPNSITRLAVGSNGLTLLADNSTATGLAWGQLGTAGIAADAVTSGKIAGESITAGKIASEAVTSGKIAGEAVTAGKIAPDAVTTVKIADDAVTGDKIADGSITSAHIADGTVIATDIADGSVTSAKILDGTIVNGDINAAAAIAHSKLANATAGQVLLGTTTTGVVTATTVSGDVTITGAGVTAISSGVIVNADVNASAAIDHSKLANITAGSVLLGNSSNVPTATALSGDVTVNSSGVTAIGSGVIVNADVNASAAIALSKLASGTSAQVVLANSSGVPTYTTVTGDVTITNAGVTAIGSSKVTSAMIVDGTIVDGDISSTAAISRGKIADMTIDTKVANYTLALTDANKMIEMNITSTANTVSVPTDASVNFPVGTQINIVQYGTGKTQVVAVTPATTSVRATPGSYLRAQYSSATLIKRAANEWYLIGDLSAS